MQIKPSSLSRVLAMANDSFWDHGAGKRADLYQL
jgi:hypothetical protein